MYIKKLIILSMCLIFANVYSIVCDKCGFDNEDKYKFCIKCGNKLEVKKEKPKKQVKSYKYCSQCGTKNSASDKFCQECGHNLDEELGSNNQSVKKQVENHSTYKSTQEKYYKKQNNTSSVKTSVLSLKLGGGFINRGSINLEELHQNEQIDYTKSYKGIVKIGNLSASQKVNLMIEYNAMKYLSIDMGYNLIKGEETLKYSLNSTEYNETFNFSQHGLTGLLFLKVPMASNKININIGVGPVFYINQYSFTAEPDREEQNSNYNNSYSDKFVAGTIQTEIEWLFSTRFSIIGNLGYLYCGNINYLNGLTYGIGIKIGIF